MSRGDLIVRQRNLPQSSSTLDCTLCWMSDEPLNPQIAYLLLHTTRQVRAHINGVTYRVNVNTLHREPAATLGLNEIGRVTLTTTQPLFFDPYPANRITGSFIFVDPFTNNTVAAGMVRSGTVRERPGGIDGQPTTLDQCHIAGRHGHRPDCAERNGHRAAVLWFTGLSGSGKSTVARQLERVLFARGVQTFFLDGDNVRHGLNGDLGFSAADRQENIRHIAENGESWPSPKASW